MNESLKTRMAEFLDPEQVEELRSIPGEGELDLFADVAQLYLRTTPQLLEDLGKGVRERDATAVPRLAHMLKGSSSNLGAFRLSEKSSRMEQEALKGALEQDQLYAEILIEYGQLKMIIGEILASGQAD